MDKAKSALNVLKTSGIDTSDVSLLDRNALGTGVDHQHVGLWRRLFGENVWEHEAAVYGDTLRKGGAVLAAWRQALDRGLVGKDERAVLFNCANGNKYPLLDRSRQMRLAEMDASLL